VRPFFVPLLALPLVLAGCVNTDAAVFVDASFETATAVVSGGSLGVTVAGDLTLKLHLGPRASGPSQVDLVSVTILDDKQSAEITVVQIKKSSVEFPVTVALDSDVTATLAYDLGGKTLPVEIRTKLCSGAGVVVRGTIQDSLLGGATPFFSSIVHPTGCP
jgi:hypothetical protein